MNKSTSSNVKNVSANNVPLSNPQKTAYDYWNEATSTLETTSKSVLDLFRRNQDVRNFRKYEHQLNDFKKTRDYLSENVEKAIGTKNLRHIEDVILDGIHKLKKMVFFLPDGNDNLVRSMSGEYNDALMILTKCISELRMKIQFVDKRLSRMLGEMKVYNALAKELQLLLTSTLKAKEEKRENVAATVIDLAPEVLSFIQSQVV